MREGYKDPFSSTAWSAAPASRGYPEPFESQSDVSSWALSDAEQVAVGRLRGAAMREGMPLTRFVDVLLRGYETPAPRPSREAAALVSEVKVLLEKLASDLPSKVAVSMSEMLRATRAREEPSPRTGEYLPAEPTHVLSPAYAVSSVPSYRTRRAKAPRVAL
jgi:hypothetical protein